MIRNKLTHVSLFAENFKEKLKYAVTHNPVMDFTNELLLKNVGLMLVNPLCSLPTPAAYDALWAAVLSTHRKELQEMGLADIPSGRVQETIFSMYESMRKEITTKMVPIEALPERERGKYFLVTVLATAFTTSFDLTLCGKAVQTAFFVVTKHGQFLKEWHSLPEYVLGAAMGISREFCTTFTIMIIRRGNPQIDFQKKVSAVQHLINHCSPFSVTAESDIHDNLQEALLALNERILDPEASILQKTIEGLNSSDTISRGEDLEKVQQKLLKGIDAVKVYLKPGAIPQMEAVFTALNHGTAEELKSGRRAFYVLAESLDRVFCAEGGFEKIFHRIWILAYERATNMTPRAKPTRLDPIDPTSIELTDLKIGETSDKKKSKKKSKKDKEKK